MLPVAIAALAAPRPHVVAVLADDLGFYDTAIYNENSPTPQIAALASHGLRLDRHYVFRYAPIAEGIVTVGSTSGTIHNACS